MKEAYLCEEEKDGNVQCYLCRQRCLIKPGKRGICMVRENREGTLYTLVYDKIAAINIDSIEKKPLFHFFPGSRAFSLGTMGCNFRCSFCQNYQLSQIQDKQGRILGDKYGPAELVGLAVKENCKSVAYTYSEPTIFYELARDTMVKAHEAGLHNVFVTNGYMSPEMIADSKGLIDAANVDIKAFDQEFYKKYVKARLEGVLESARLLKENGVWLEITTLLIPGANDGEDELKGLASFIKTELGPDTPWHVSRFHPNYKEDGIPPTPAQSLNRAAEIGKERGLNYVYVGNISPNTYENTYCPQCGELLMERVGFTMADYNIKSGRCSQCSHTIPGVGL